MDKYNEALEKARKSYKDYKKEYDNCKDKKSTAALVLSGCISALEEQFPELTESEDERIRKYLIEELKVAKSVGELLYTIPQPTREECIAYLEKQKEQKPAEVDESTKRLNENWMKQYFDDYKEQKPAEWSEEDRMETINVFRPLAGTSIESATKQAVNKFTNSGKKFLLAFNGVFILIDNTKSVQDIVSEYNRSLGGKKKEQGQSEGEPNDFEITLNDCMLAAQQYPPGKIGWDEVKMWAEELSNYCPQPNQKWSEFDWHCLERAIWYVENPAPNVVKDTNLVLWLKSLRPQPKLRDTYYDIIHDILATLKDMDFSQITPEHRVSLLNDIRVKCKNADECAKILDEPAWKPSEEQMEALLWCTAHLGGADHRVLAELYEHLKMYCL